MAEKKLSPHRNMEILDLVDAEKSTKWERRPLKQKINLEMDSTKQTTLGLRLTFDKRQEGLPIPRPFRETLVKMLERTDVITQKGWFSNTPNPTLGTLGYLPAEIRLIIWEHLFLLLHLKADESHRYDPRGRIQTSCYPWSNCYVLFNPESESLLGPYEGTVINLLKALPRMTSEIHHTYLSTRTFYFPTPRCMEDYLEVIAQHAASLRNITMLLTEDLKANRAWIDAIDYLPKDLDSMTFKLSGFCTGYKTLKYVQAQLSVLDTLNKRAIRTAPTARILIQEAERSDRHSVAVWAVIEAVMTDCER